MSIRSPITFALVLATLAAPAAGDFHTNPGAGGSDRSKLVVD